MHTLGSIQSVSNQYPMNNTLMTASELTTTLGLRNQSFIFSGLHSHV